MSMKKKMVLCTAIVCAITAILLFLLTYNGVIAWGHANENNQPPTIPLPYDNAECLEEEFPNAEQLEKNKQEDIDWLGEGIKQLQNQLAKQPRKATHVPIDYIPGFSNEYWGIDPGEYPDGVWHYKVGRYDESEPMVQQRVSWGECQVYTQRARGYQIYQYYDEQKKRTVSYVWLYTAEVRLEGVRPEGESKIRQMESRFQNDYNWVVYHYEELPGRSRSGLYINTLAKSPYWITTTVRIENLDTHTEEEIERKSKELAEEWKEKWEVEEPWEAFIDRAPDELAREKGYFDELAISAKERKSHVFKKKNEWAKDGRWGSTTFFYEDIYNEDIENPMKLEITQENLVSQGDHISIAGRRLDMAPKYAGWGYNVERIGFAGFVPRDNAEVIEDEMFGRK